MSLEHYLAEHLQDLSDKSEREFCFTFSDFLSEEELSEVLQMKKRFGPITVFGGAPGTARNLVRFGSEDSLGYDEDFPVCCLQISPKNERFAEELSHRDVLGALMNLGIERRLLGDIVVRSKTAYLFCTQRIADYLIRNMERIRHTDVRLTVCESLPEGELFTTRRVRITAASLRLDCVLAGVWNKSRSAVDELLRQKKVFVNGVLTENGSKTLAPGDKVSARGFGKFQFSENAGHSKKGKEVLLIDIYE